MQGPWLSTCGSVPRTRFGPHTAATVTCSFSPLEGGRGSGGQRPVRTGAIQQFTGSKTSFGNDSD